MTFLKEILDSKRVEIENLASLDDLKNQFESENCREVRMPIWTNQLDVIAEIKRRSPSKGILAEIENPEVLAKKYENGGATIISVLTDEKYFGALPTDLQAVRNCTSIPILRKDFIIDERQVYESFLIGADMILLIVAAFDNVENLSTLYKCASKLGLSVLVEAHNENEIAIANDIGAQIVGVNVRDLETFEEDPTVGDTLIKKVRKEAISVWESSITTIEQATRAKQSGAGAVLIGQGLVQNENPTEFIQQIRNISIP